MGPSIAIRLREVPAYERLKTRKHHRGSGVAVMPSNPCLARTCKIPVSPQNM